MENVGELFQWLLIAGLLIKLYRTRRALASTMLLVDTLGDYEVERQKEMLSKAKAELFKIKDRLENEKSN